MSLKITKTVTSNPFIDLLLFYIKTLAYGCIIKDEQEAIDNETEVTCKAFDEYSAAYENRAVFELYDYGRDILEISSLPKVLIDSCLISKENIPEEYRTEILELKKAQLIANYVELNEYYRKITGLPPIGEEGIKITDYISMIPEGEDYDPTKYLHEMDTDTIRMLDSYGVIDAVKAAYHTKLYLKYLTAGIDAYTARNALKFQILYLPTIDNSDVKKKFEDKFMDNRNYVLQAVYSEAFKFGSDYYDKFMMVFIIINTMTDMLAEVQEHIVTKNILDRRCIAYIFEMYGVPYYREIPIKYQIAMVKNINTLIKYKSCTKGIVNIIDLFGCKDINVFRYFLLKDRKSNVYGDPLFNYIETITSDENDCVVLETASTDLPITTEEIDVPFPFDYYMEKGNVMFIMIDDYLLYEGTDYIIYGKHIDIFDKTLLENKKKINYLFYYDKTTKDVPFTVPDTHSVNTHTANVIVSEDHQKVFDIPVPYDNYFVDGNKMLLSLGSVFIDRDRYEVINNQAIFADDEEVMEKDLTLTFIFIYSRNQLTVDLKFSKADVIATQDNQTVFAIPEPFQSYSFSGNDFFITVGSTYIDKSRYSNDNTNITFLNETITKGRAVTFNFIYDKVNEYKEIELITKQVDIIATEAYQVTFDVPYPFEGYLEKGYKVFVKLRGWFLEYDYYELFSSCLVLKDPSMALQPGDKISLYFMYSMTDNHTITSTYVTATTDNQLEFDITFPVQNFLETGNKLIVNANGILISPTKYTIADGKLKITDKAYAVDLYDNINFTFIYNSNYMYHMRIKDYTVLAKIQGQKKFIVQFPFHGYLESGNGIIVLHKNMFVDPNFYTIADGKIEFNDNIDFLLAESITILFIYNSRYENYNKNLIVETRTIDTLKELGDEACIEVPQPFSDFVKNLWPFFIDHSRSFISDEHYDVLNTSVLFDDLPTIMTYPTLSFTFIYKLSYTHSSMDEDYAADFNLKFVKVPIEDFEADKYVKKKSNYLGYDYVTLGDPLWDAESRHEDIKLALLKKEFNYIRTKYLSVDYVCDLSDMTFEICYFYNMLYDDVMFENDVKLNLQCISENKKFRLADIFIYLTVLAYNYSGINDSIMDTPTKVMYVKGFNFHTDLNTLRNYILEERRIPEHFAVWNWKEEKEQLASVTQFLDIFRTNKEVYKTVCTEMWKSKDKTIYDIWKTLYDSLMITKFNLDFFKLSDGTVAKTFTDFLKDKDKVLYNSAKKISNITDEDTRLGTIIQMITDVVYLLEEYIDSDEFKYIYSNLPGISARFVLNYIFKIINFFKSYKVILYEMNVQFILDDKNQNMIRPMDKLIMTSKLRKLDRVELTEKKISNQQRLFKEDIELLDKILMTPYYE